MNKPLLDEDAVRALTDAQIFQRGLHYLRCGAVSQLVRRGNRLTAQVDGSEAAPYDVAVDLRDRGAAPPHGVAAMRCTCPYDWGGACKHVVAVLLKYIETPDATIEQAPLYDHLQTLDHTTLAALIIKRADQDTAFALWLEAELAIGTIHPPARDSGRTPVNLTPIRRQIEAILVGRGRHRHRWHDDGPEIDEEALSTLIDRAKPFLATGDGHNALRILRCVTEALVKAWHDQADWDETLHEFFPELGQMIAEAVLMNDLEKEERDDLMIRIDVWQSALDDYGLGDHLQVAIDALEQGWNEIGLDGVLIGKGSSWPISAHTDRATAQLTQARLRVLEICGRTDAFLNLAAAAGCHNDYAAMLVRLRRAPEAIAHARRTLRTAEQIFAFVRLLQETGEIDSALDIAAWGLQQKGDDSRSYARVALARWLRQCANLCDQREPAIAAARHAFEQALSLEDYQAAKFVAAAGWATLRPHLLAHLALASDAHERTEIYLTEGMIDEAVRSIDLDEMLNNPSNPVLLRLARAACASHVDWTIALAERMAAAIMDTGHSSRYPLAAKWLAEALRAYDAADRYEDWMAKIDGLIEKHRRKHKLRPLLEALRSGAHDF